LELIIMHSLHSQTLSTQPPLAHHIFDEDGFLIDPSLWSEQLARSLAEAEGLGPLTEEHWRVVSYIREKFQRLGAPSNLRQVCRGTELTRPQIKNLFGGCLVIWRIAGLPNPGEEAKSYLS
jgi:dissimilatory sulfite reductase related protein